MSYRQPPPSARRLALLERRPRRLGDINWTEIVGMIAWSGAAYLPLAVAARLALGAFERPPLGWLSSSGPVQSGLVVFAASGVGYVIFRLLGSLLIATTWLIFYLSRTPVRQDWIAGFLAGGVAVIATLPLTAGNAIEPFEFLMGPFLAILIAQPPTTYVAARELRRYVRCSFWSADDQLLVAHRSLNLQISIAALFGLTTVASFVLGLMRMSGLLDQPVGQATIAGMVLQLAMLPGSVWLAHWLLGGSKREVPKAADEPEPRQEQSSVKDSPW